MSLFDLQDVCIAIGSLATLDLPMVVDLIGIYGLKGPYCTLTTTNCSKVGRPLLSQSRRRPPPSPPPPPLSDRTCSDQLFEEFPSVLISSGLLVQADEGTLLLVMDLIRRNLPPPTVKSQSPCDSGWSQAPVASETGSGSAPLSQQWYQSQGSDPSIQLFPYCIRSRVLKSKHKNFYFGAAGRRRARQSITRATPCALAAHGGRELGVASRNCCAICLRPLLAGWRMMAVDFAHWMRHWSAHHAPCAAHVAASVRPSAARYVVAAAAVRRRSMADYCDS
ncbi:hypothetical protein F511_35370 [Dorcoceras hygrometricum]|uniref:Uncharacterized protein n=1 Tax=Dorcoceras hygrometricum TaxID=472368 RepID=A0A2Z7AP25_9LAMI|nr:hypothetical protein F511_35370 [Dorcoceras hygrometricum]